jgi:hypothetical protein
VSHQDETELFSGIKIESFLGLPRALQSSERCVDVGFTVIVVSLSGTAQDSINWP